MIDGGEWIVILLVALMVLGPERLPVVSRKLGGWARELRMAAREMRTGLEAEVAEVKQVRDDLVQPIREVRSSLRDASRLAAEANPSRIAWEGPKPVSGPTPADAMADLDRIEAGEPPVEDQE